MHAFGAGIRPGRALIRRASEHHERARRIGAEAIDQVFRVDDVLFRLGHFLDAAFFDRPMALRTLPAVFFRAYQFTGKQPVMLDTPIGLFRHHPLGQ